MTGGNQDYYRGLPITAAILPWTLVRDNGLGQWVNCTAGQSADAVFKVTSDATMATLTPAFVGPGEILMRGKIRELSASGAITAYVPVYTDAAGQITATNTGYRVGIALEAASALNDVISVFLSPGTPSVFSTLAAPTASLTNKTAEAIAASASFYANTLGAGDVIEVDAIFVASAHSTDTTRLIIRWGGLTGTIVADTTAVASLGSTQAGRISAKLVVQSTGATGKVAGGGDGIWSVASAGTAILPIDAGQITTDTTAAQVICLTIIQGSSNAGNTLVVDQFTVKRFAAA